MQSSAALLPASVAAHFGDSALGLQVLPAPVDAFRGPFDVGAGGFQAHGVGHDQLVGIALLLAEWRARLDARLRIGMARRSAAQPAQAKGRHHEARG